MDFRFDEEQVALRRQVRDLVQKRIAPLAGEMDSSYEVHEEGLRIIKESGLFSYLIPKEYGGRGISSVNLCIIREELSRVSTFADEAFIMQGLGGYPIVAFGSEEQRSRYLPRFLDGSLLVNFCLSEPAAGSDVAAIESTARLHGDHYLLTGRKCWVSKPAYTDVSVVFAKTDPSAGKRGISAFIVDRDQSPYEVREDRLVFETNIGEIIMDQMPVPRENLLGREGQGMRIALGNLTIFRPTVGAASLGMARRAFELALEHAKDRRMFGQTLADFQVTQFKLAQMKVELDAAALLVYRAAWIADNLPKPSPMESSAAKYFATEVAQGIVDRAVQIHGGMGIHKRSKVEQLYRAVRAPRIYEGASEIQLLVIARELMRGMAHEPMDRL